MIKKGLLFTLLISLFACGSDDSPGTTNLVFEDLEVLTQDRGGEHEAIPLINSNTHYGYYMYEPSGYASDEEDYPLLVYLHGIDDLGDPILQNDLDLVLRNGPPKMIDEGSWNPRFPMLVASPQLFKTQLDWQPNDLHEFIEHLESKYRVNPERIYITGISIGGVGIFEYLRNLGSRQKAAAVVPIAGAGAELLVSTISDVHIWAFHGEEDRVIPFERGSKPTVDAINASNPRFRALITTYPGVGHDAWTITYNESGMGMENPRNDRFNQSVFDWMFNRRLK